MGEDSVPIFEKNNTINNFSNLKLLVSIFILFIVVVSDVFTSSVISNFGESAIVGRTPTAWGITLQGIFLIIFYIIAVHLIENDVL